MGRGGGEIVCKWSDKVLLSVPIPDNLSHNGKMFWKNTEVDSCIAPIVKALNDSGIYTSGCCCGHGKTEGTILLHDGEMIELAR